MWKDDLYSLTIKHDSEIQRHFYFNVYLKLIKLPEYYDNAILNVTYNWQALAMIDTGATRSGITSSFIKKMGLTPIGETTIFHAVGSSVTSVYTFDVIFPDEKEFENIEAAEISNAVDCDFVVGMDILRHGDFAFSSENGIMAFSFRSPPMGKYIDFEIY